MNSEQRLPVEVVVAVSEDDAGDAIVRRHVAPVAGDRVQLWFSRDREELKRLLPRAEVLFGVKLEPWMLAEAPRLRWAQLNVAGVERSMTSELAASAVVLTNSRGMHKVQMAEHAVALMLAFAKRLHVAIRAQGRRVWAYDAIATSSFSLAGLICGILGLGSIGLEIGRAAAAFGMRVTGTRRRLPAGWRPPGWLERVTDEAGTDSVLREADFLIVALPLTGETRNLLDGVRLARMKRGAYLINVARGAIVDEAALAACLRSGQLAGAGLDVTAVEPLPPGSPLWDMENVILTPHVSGNYPVYADDAARLFAQNLGRYLLGQPLQNMVDKTLGY